MSLIKVGKSALANAEKQSLDVTALQAALEHARKTVETPVSEKPYAKAMRRLRKEIRAFDSIPEASLETLTYFPVSVW